MNERRLHLTYLWTVFVLGVICATPVFAQSSAAVQALLERGDAHYAQFDNRQALEAYELAFETAPRDFDVLLRLARTHNDYAQDLLAGGDEDEAEAHFMTAIKHAEALVEHYPDRPESHFFLAATTGKLAQFSGGKEKVRIGRDVETYARRAIKLDPEYALPYVALGIFYRELANLNWIQRTFANTFFGGLPDGDIEDSARMLERALSLNDSLNVAHFELALTYEQMGNRTGAIRHLERAIALPPATTNDVRNKAEAARLLKKWDG